MSPSVSMVSNNGSTSGNVLATLNVCENVVTTSVINVRKPKRNGISDSPSNKTRVRAKPLASGDFSTGTSTARNRVASGSATRADSYRFEGSCRSAATTNSRDTGEKTRPATSAPDAIPVVLPHAQGNLLTPIHQKAGGAAIGRMETQNSNLRAKNSRVPRMIPKLPPTNVEVAAPAAANVNVCANEDQSVATLCSEKFASRKINGAAVTARRNPIGKIARIDDDRVAIPITSPG